MAPAVRMNLSDKIRLAIENEIASGLLAAGSRLDEQMLMDRFEVSRTPAREALQVLITKGLLTTLSRQGAVVASLSSSEYVAMLEILMELEGLAARLSARRMPKLQRDELQAAYQGCVDAADQDDAVAYAVVNKRFHEIIYDSSRNDLLATQLRSMRARMRNPQLLMFDRPGRIRSSLTEHRAVLDAILAGDEDAASTAMKAHISRGGNVYADTIAALTNWQEPAFEERAPAAPVASAKRSPRPLADKTRRSSTKASRI